MKMFKFELPVKTISEANCSQHWTAKATRHKSQQFVIRLAYDKYKIGFKLPCQVKMTRLAPRLLDDDNLSSAFKYIRDELSECIIPNSRKTYVTASGKIRHIKGMADSDPRIKWSYSQEKHPMYGIRIEVTEDE